MISNKKKYKLLSFEKKEDFIYALFRLIIQVKSSLEQYKKYTSDLESDVEPFLKTEGSLENLFVSADSYNSIHRKLHDVSADLMKYIADMQDSSISYNMLRKIADRKKSIISLPSLSTDVVNEIKELLDVRNWSFHNPQSLYVADKEKFEKQIPDELKQFIDWNMTFNPIKIVLPTKYDACCLVSLYLHASRRIKVFELILESMLKDYSALLGKKASIEMIHDPGITPFLSDSDRQIQLSMAIQKGQYSGSLEDYRRITFSDVK